MKKANRAPGPNAHSSHPRASASEARRRDEYAWVAPAAVVAHLNFTLAMRQVIKYCIVGLFCSSAFAKDIVPPKPFLDKAALVCQGKVCAVKEDRRMWEFAVIEPVAMLTESQARRIGAVLAEPQNYAKNAIFSIANWDAKAVLSDREGSFLLEVIFSSQFGEVILRLDRLECTGAVVRDKREEILKVLTEALPENQDFMALLAQRLNEPPASAQSAR